MTLTGTQLRDEMNIRNLKVIDIDPESESHDTGVRQNWTIHRINGQYVTQKEVLEMMKEKNQLTVEFQVKI